MAVALMSAALTPAGATVPGGPGPAPVQVGRQPHGSIAVGLQEITGSPASHSCPRNKPRTVLMFPHSASSQCSPLSSRKMHKSKDLPWIMGPTRSCPHGCYWPPAMPPTIQTLSLLSLQLSAGTIVHCSLQTPSRCPPNRINIHKHPWV